MVATLTPRVKYTLDPAGQIGVQHANWDRADEVAGLIYTTAGVTPSNTVLYDGAVVSEKDTGISYRVFDNGSGGYNKKYVNYPYFFQGWGSRNGVGNGTPGESGWTNFDNNYCVNNNDSWISPAAASFKPQVKAYYSMNFHYSWFPYATNGVRGSGFHKNGVAMYTQYQSTRAAPGPPFPCRQHLCVTLLLVPGDIITSYMYNTSNDVQDTIYTLEAVLIRPVW